MSSTRVRIAAAVAGLLVTGLVAPAIAAGVAAAGPAPATDRLREDATAPLVTSGGRGPLRFAGVRGRGRIDNPHVDADTGLETAARAHLKRYGHAFGADRPGTVLAVAGSRRAVSGQDVVRFQQRVDGLPVLGADVVVSLKPDRDLASMSAALSSAEQVPTAEISETDAAATARILAARALGRTDSRTAALDVSPQGRAVFDPAVFGEPAPQGARSGWSFEVTAPGAVRRLLLVDDQTGAPLLNLDENQQLDRVVCDNNDVVRSDLVPCKSDFARTESDPATGVADVNDAFDLAGAVSDFYAQIGGLDLTQLLGISTSAGEPKLAATVHWCDRSDGCPLENAFWDGHQMYYGSGYAGADDVVGHEMTHGVIDHFSRLFYWGQSGAINESLADIMGEIVDHRHASTGDAPNDWRLGEDLPGGALRSLADPTLFQQPDRMTSDLYTSDVSTGYADNGGVHTNSGVGNKTAYLISQGGTFNGQTFSGIDAGDTTLTKTATLYLDTIEKLASGSDYADLAARLDQSCQDLAATGTAGFTTAMCTSVHAATVATQLRMTPTQAAQPVDAQQTCPKGTVKRVLVDSEAGTAADVFAPGQGWTRNPSPTFGRNATSDPDSWSNTSDSGLGDAPVATSLTLAQPVHLPAGQPSYLWFQGWYLFEYGPAFNGDPQTHFFDGGTVEVDSGSGLKPAESLPWVDGPNRTLFTGADNPASGRLAFGGDSRGWVASRADLSGFAGHDVRAAFTEDLDESSTFIGWFLDDITIYSCYSSVVNEARPQIGGTARVGGALRSSPGRWAPRVDSYTYQWLRDGVPLRGATAAAYTLGVADLGHRITLRVTARAPGLTSGTADSAATARVGPGLIVGRRPLVSGKPKVRKVLRAVVGAWRPAGVTLGYRWLRSGKVIRRATRASYRLTKQDRGKRVSVRVTGRKAGYSTVALTSARTRKVR